MFLDAVRKNYEFESDFLNRNSRYFVESKRMSPLRNMNSCVIQYSYVQSFSILWEYELNSYSIKENRPEGNKPVLCVIIFL